MDTGTIIGYIIFFVVLFGIVYLFDKHSKKKKETERMLYQSRVDQAKEYIKNVNQEKKIPSIATHLLLKDNEFAYLQDDVRFFETRKVAVSNRSGGAVRVAKGVYIGGTSGRSRSYDEMREIDQGALILTNKRLVFDGSQNTRDINLEKLLSVTQYKDGIEIAIEGKNKSQFYIGMFNPILWKSLIYVVRQIPASGEIPNVNLEIQ